MFRFILISFLLTFFLSFFPEREASAHHWLFNKIYDYYDSFANKGQEDTPFPYEFDKKVHRVTVMQGQAKTLELSSNAKDCVKNLSPLLGSMTPSTGGPSLALSESLGVTSMEGMNCISLITRADLNLVNEQSGPCSLKAGPSLAINIDSSSKDLHYKDLLKANITCLGGVETQMDWQNSGGGRFECGIGYRRVQTQTSAAPGGAFVYTAKTITAPLGTSIRVEDEYFFKKRDLTTRQKENWNRRINRLNENIALLDTY